MAIKTAHTIEFIVKGNDFFVANLDDGGIRVGMVGGVCYNLIRDNALFGVAANCSNEADAESCFDLCVENYGL